MILSSVVNENSIKYRNPVHDHPHIFSDLRGEQRRRARDHVRVALRFADPSEHACSRPSSHPPRCSYLHTTGSSVDQPLSRGASCYRS
jgi:hypothetical protein